MFICPFCKRVIPDFYHLKIKLLFEETVLFEELGDLLVCPYCRSYVPNDEQLLEVLKAPDNAERDDSIEEIEEIKYSIADPCQRPAEYAWLTILSSQPSTSFRDVEKAYDLFSKVLDKSLACKWAVYIGHRKDLLQAAKKGIPFALIWLYAHTSKYEFPSIRYLEAFAEHPDKYIQVNDWAYFALNTEMPIKMFSEWLDSGIDVKEAAVWCGLIPKRDIAIDSFPERKGYQVPVSLVQLCKEKNIPPKKLISILESGTSPQAVESTIQLFGSEDIEKHARYFKDMNIRASHILKIIAEYNISEDDIAMWIQRWPLSELARYLKKGLDFKAAVLIKLFNLRDVRAAKEVVNFIASKNMIRHKPVDKSLEQRLLGNE